LGGDNCLACAKTFVMFQITAHASHASEALASPALTAPFGDEAVFASLRLSAMMLLSPLGDLSAKLWFHLEPCFSLDLYLILSRFF
jgi:hypothetical protein